MALVLDISFLCGARVINHMTFTAQMIGLKIPVLTTECPWAHEQRWQIAVAAVYFQGICANTEMAIKEYIV